MKSALRFGRKLQLLPASSLLLILSEVSGLQEKNTSSCRIAERRGLPLAIPRSTLLGMIFEVLARPKLRGPVLRALQGYPNGDENGGAGEERFVASGVSWDRYLELDAALGHDRPGPRLYYLDGELEIMTTSLKHEELKKWLAALIEDYLFETGVETFPHGQATLKILREAGAEPDDSWCFGEQKDFPDVVLEIALTSGGLDKLKVYRRLAVPEVWLWRKGALEIWTLRRDRSSYDGPAKKSRLLPGLDVAALTRCLGLASWREARRAFRETLRKHKR